MYLIAHSGLQHPSDDKNCRKGEFGPYLATVLRDVTRKVFVHLLLSCRKHFGIYIYTICSP